MATLKNLSLSNKGLRYKLMVSFSLMAIIPILALTYALSPYLFPGFKIYVNIDTIVFTAIIISILGLMLAKSAIQNVIDLSMQARVIANGDYNKEIPALEDDELDNLGQSINKMTKKIKSNLEELKSYGQSMKEINVEIHKKVITLSSLLEIGDIVSAGSMQIDSLLELAIEKVSGLFDNGYGVLYMAREEGGDFIAKTSYNINKEKVIDIVIHRNGRAILDKLLSAKALLQVDSDSKITPEIESLRNEYNLKNILAIPIRSNRDIYGMLLLGNNTNDFIYTKDDIDMVNVFAKHIMIAIESDRLSKKNKELATRDDLTGLFNKRYLMTRLEEEIKRAIFYQRPCSLIVIDIDNFKIFRDSKGELVAEEALKRIAKIIKDNTNPVGKAARIGDDEFMMLLPEKNKRESVFIAEEVRKKIEASNILKEGKANLTVSVGVSENPIDGSTSEELFKKATDSLLQAKADGRNRVVA